MRRMLFALALAGLAACEVPPVFAGADKRQNTSAGRIDGTVVVSSAARGNVLLFLYDAARPPPPTGTGRPLTFTVLTKETVFGEAPVEGDVGPFTAPFSFSLVAPGQYLVRGFIDVNDDFIPWYSVTSEMNAGDVGGVAVDANRAPRTVAVELDSDENPVAAVGVRVLFADTLATPVDRPAFEASVASLTLGSANASIELSAKAIVEGKVAEGNPIFLASLVDSDGNGKPDDANGDNVPDFWPHVVVRKISASSAQFDSVLLDENDLDKNGVLDPPGTGIPIADYEHIDLTTGATIARDGAPDLVVLAAGFDFATLMPTLVDETGKVKSTPTPVSKLTLVIKPQAIDMSNPTHPQVIKGVPSGRYAITVIQSTGQTWRVPNELDPELAGVKGFTDVSSQGFIITVP